MKKGVLVIGALVLAVAMFAAGAFAGPRVLGVLGLGGAVTVGPGGVAGGAPGTFAGGPMANLTEEERAQVQNMTDEERRAFFQRKMGGRAPIGAGGSAGRGGAIEGEVLEVASDTVTVKTSAGGSQVVYRDADTVVAYAKDAEQTELATGDEVIVLAEPEGDNVLSAKAIVVK